MTRWQNWSGRHQVNLGKLAFLRSEEDAQALVRHCAGRGEKLRAAGAGHSHSPVVVNNEVIADTSGLSGILDVDTAARRAWIRAGTPIYALGLQLHEHGLALRNQGDIDRQLLGGVIATGTHGTGRHLQNVSASVTGLQLILASGEIVECNAEREAGLFETARLSLGSVGLVTRIQMQLRESCVLKEKGWNVSFDELVDDIPSVIEQNDRFEFFWYPGTDEATVKTINETNEAPVYPLADEGERQAWSHEVLPSHRPHLHTEMEYSVPAENGIACLKEIRQLLKSGFPDVMWPVEYRTVAADDIWLSMASGRPTVTISVHQDIREDEEPYFRACEEVFLSYGGRPHWGKVHYIGGEEFRHCYARWDEFWEQRNALDPQGIFLNAWAERLNPGNR